MEALKSQQGSVTILTIKGAMIADALDVLDARMDECVNEGASKMVLDLGNVPFIDSAGLEKILSIVGEMGKRARDVRIASLNDVCRDIFAVTLMENFVRVHEDRESAVRGLL